MVTHKSVLNHTTCSTRVTNLSSLFLCLLGFTAEEKKFKACYRYVVVLNILFEMQCTKTKGMITKNRLKYCS